MATNWASERLFAVRSAKGELDADTGLLAAIAHSCRIDLQWYAQHHEAQAIWISMATQNSNAAAQRAAIARNRR